MFMRDSFRYPLDKSGQLCPYFIAAVLQKKTTGCEWKVQKGYCSGNEMTKISLNNRVG
jgi:hypothetical protein